MDNVLVDFSSAFPRIDPFILMQFHKERDNIPGLFALMDPMPGALESVHFLAEHFDTYILSTAPWNNHSAWTDKAKWIQTHLPEIGYKRLILSHHKNLNKGDYLVDDRKANGADRFEGEHIHFGQVNFHDWMEVTNYLCRKEGLDHKVFQRDEKDNSEAMINTAARIIEKEFELKKDKAGQPYVGHLYRVHARVRHTGAPFETRCAALLHDLLEDCPEWTPERLGQIFPERVVSLVKILTHAADESYMDYIDRIRGNEEAVRIKLADLEDNMDLTRIGQITEKDEQRLRRYMEAKQRLTSA